MDCKKVGNLLLGLRKEKGMTQKQLADAMNISDKTISKWERGIGCPDVSLLHELSKVLSVNIEKILLGELDPNNADGGNMKRIKFYVCPTCGNIITSTGEAEISCCGRKLSALNAKPSDEKHYLKVETIEEDYYITFSHEMTKKHYLNFISYVTCDRVLIVRLYPEQSGEVRFPKLYGGKLFFGCSQHGLWVNEKE
ncbi:helix-turn-helix domain-containing protein [Anaeromicropila populeti]|uniref:Helix-turn-helix n=1 Tax=Anaeromicropila populeti TaxID=37658 RepID=A0A1I6LKP8_9FIRM|nr:helix-turn-helix domain-containing protein [Anaeromicropila populeti]SFS03872.1 Helix-turn-helix [Anaeromicropila populeti]